jgi:hypothetical protein
MSLLMRLVSLPEFRLLFGMLKGHEKQRKFIQMYRPGGTCRTSVRRSESGTFLNANVCHSNPQLILASPYFHGTDEGTPCFLASAPIHRFFRITESGYTRSRQLFTWLKTPRNLRQSCPRSQILEVAWEVVGRPGVLRSKTARPSFATYDFQRNESIVKTYGSR